MSQKIKKQKDKDEDCRICNGPCKGVETHEATRRTWLTQEPATVENWWKLYKRTRGGEDE